jgi:hypothetical protein
MRDLNEINKEIKTARKTLIATADKKQYTEAQNKLANLLAEKRAFMNQDSGDFEMTENCWHKTH